MGKGGRGGNAHNQAMGRSSQEKSPTASPDPHIGQPIAVVASNEARFPVWVSIGRHWATPMILSVALTFDGPGNLSIKIPALALCALWIIVDVCLYFLQKKKLALWRSIALCAATQLILLTSSAAIYWLIDNHFDEERKATFNGIVISVVAPPSDPVDSIFTVSNGSEHEIARHAFRCELNLIVLKGGDKYWAQFSTTEHVFTGDLKGSGDSHTYECLNFLNAKFPPDYFECFDVTAVFDYTLASQPNTNQSRRFRLVANDKDGFVWIKQPLNSPEFYCAGYLSPSGREDFKNLLVRNLAFPTKQQ